MPSSNASPLPIVSARKPHAVVPALCMVLAWMLGGTLMAGCASGAKSEKAEKADLELEADDQPENTATLAPATDVSGTPWAAQSVAAIRAEGKSEALEWEIFRVPGKQPTRYRHVQHEGRDAVLAMADASGSILRHRFRIEPSSLGRVSFSWNVPDPASGANAAIAQLEDVPVRVVLAFEGDRARFSVKNALLSELSELITGEPLPYATLIYSWSRVRPPGEVIANNQTDRIRKLVVESGDGSYNQWRTYERDVRADFQKAFGEAPGALVSFAVFTEGERSHGPLKAWYGPVVLKPTP